MQASNTCSQGALQPKTHYTSIGFAAEAALGSAQAVPGAGHNDGAALPEHLRFLQHPSAAEGGFFGPREGGSLGMQGCAALDQALGRAAGVGNGHSALDTQQLDARQGGPIQQPQDMQRQGQPVGVRGQTSGYAAFDWG